MSFDRIAPHYDWLEALTAGSRLQRARCAFLDRLGPCRRVLSAGEGHGRFAAAFARRFPAKTLICVDASEPMLARARRRVARVPAPAAPVSWICQALPGWLPPVGAFDAIVTCFFLDCFPEAQMATIIAALALGAAPGALWINADFAVPPGGPSRWRALAIHRLMYSFFRLTTALPAQALTPPGDLLRTHGFRLAERREWEWGLIRADCWQRGRSPHPRTEVAAGGTTGAVLVEDAPPPHGDPR